MRLTEKDKLKRTSMERRSTPNHSYWMEEKGLMNVYKYICNHCGNREREKTNYCSYCGYIMDEDPATETQEVKDGVFIAINKEN